MYTSPNNGKITVYTEHPNMALVLLNTQKRGESVYKSKQWFYTEHPNMALVLLNIHKRVHKYTVSNTTYTEPLYHGTGSTRRVNYPNMALVLNRNTEREYKHKTILIIALVLIYITELYYNSTEHTHRKPCTPCMITPTWHWFY